MLSTIAAIYSILELIPSEISELTMQSYILSPDPTMNKPNVILLDVEGTTVPISFVYNTLFPYARKHITSWLANCPDDAEIRDALALLAEENLADMTFGAPPFRWSTDHTDSQASAAPYCLWLIDLDRKSRGLKVIQGRIWQNGFEAGELQSDIFPDIPHCFTNWRSNGIRIAIYSSGSVTAQKLVFTYTAFGNLLNFIDAFFDTAIGSKQEPSSYRQLVQLLQVSASEVLFVSDSMAELDAAAGPACPPRYR